MSTRNTYINIDYEGKNISQDIAPFLSSFSFSDNSGGTADDLSITLQDRNSLWLTSWNPIKGDKIKASIILDKQTLPCGVFSVDQIDYSAPPHTLSIKAVSVSVKAALSGEKKSRAWENTYLKTIASDIASSGNLQLFYDVDDDIFFERIEQAMQSDLEFLKGICSDYDLNVKVSRDKLIIYDEEAYSEKPSSTTININDNKLKSFKFSSKSAKTYSKAKVKYHHAKKNKTFTETVSDDSVEGSGKTLEIHEYTSTSKNAKKKAKKKLAKANSKEITGTLSLMGDIRFLAGITLTVEGFGIFSGKYLLKQVTHKVDASGYTTELNLQMGGNEKKKVKAKKKKKKSGGTLYYEGDKYYRSESN